MTELMNFGCGPVAFLGNVVVDGIRCPLEANNEGVRRERLFSTDGAHHLTDEKVAISVFNLRRLFAEQTSIEAMRHNAPLPHTETIRHRVSALIHVNSSFPARIVG